MFRDETINGSSDLIFKLGSALWEASPANVSDFEIFSLDTRHDLYNYFEVIEPHNINPFDELHDHLTLIYDDPPNFSGSTCIRLGINRLGNYACFRSFIRKIESF
jgi:hypothetical protein